jgi:hypothetical protein
MPFVIKAAVADARATTYVFERQKTMYGGKLIAAGDVIYIFASENEGGAGLVARGVVTVAEAVPRRPGIARQTPRVSITVRRTGLAKRPLGRRELKGFTRWKDGRPETELNFKLYRQATDKVVGISEPVAAFLQTFFSPRAGARAPARRGSARDRTRTPRRTRNPAGARAAV